MSTLNILVYLLLMALAFLNARWTDSFWKGGAVPIVAYWSGLFMGAAGFVNPP